MQCPKPVDSRFRGNPVILPELIEKSTRKKLTFFRQNSSIPIKAGF